MFDTRELRVTVRPLIDHIQYSCTEGGVHRTRQLYTSYLLSYETYLYLLYIDCTKG